MTSHKLYKKSNWITKGIITSCKRKRELYKLYKVTNNSNLKTHYKMYSNILKKVINEAKLKCNQEFIIKAENKGKAIWDIVRKESGKCSNNTRNEIEININGQLVCNPHEIANTFNNFFTNVAQNKKNSSYMQHTTLLCPKSNNTIFLNPVTPEELLEVISDLKNSRSPE